jgi:hypothetical protein
MDVPPDDGEEEAPLPSPEKFHVPEADRRSATLG